LIAPQNHIVLVDYATEIRFAIQEHFATDEGEPRYLPSFPLQEVTELVILEALELIPEILIYSATGNLHRVSKEVLHLVHGRDELGNSRSTFGLFHIDDMKIDLSKLSVLSLGLDDQRKSSRFLRDKIVCQIVDFDFELATRFADFDGYFLTAPKGVLPSFQETELFKILAGTATSIEDALSERQIESVLRSAIKAGKLPRRDVFWREHGSHLKADAFKAIWRAVAKDHPQLSKPGPKPSA
jgi:hypothetical protein